MLLAFVGEHYPKIITNIRSGDIFHKICLKMGVDFNVKILVEYAIFIALTCYIL